MAGKERKVLVSVDGSEQSLRAFDWYCENIHKPGDFCLALNVTEFSMHGLPGILSNPDAVVDEYKQKKQVTDKLMSDFADKMRQKGIKGSADTVPGGGSSPGEEIVKMAESNKVSLIVMGTRGLGKIRRTILGSVSDYVLHHAQCPVVIVRPEQ
ncbi:hypothetical protein ACJMK2_017244 [Sinanodonta woodiana]|uniref:UspA domain-containing protein n=1 Tax=Sinanodonta woodiana TaxID=1069815 RepID=A0ABD3UW86_SINWO